MVQDEAYPHETLGYIEKSLYKDEQHVKMVERDIECLQAELTTMMERLSDKQEEEEKILLNISSLENDVREYRETSKSIQEYIELMGQLPDMEPPPSEASTISPTTRITSTPGFTTKLLYLERRCEIGESPPRLVLSKAVDDLESEYSRACKFRDHTGSVNA